MAIDDRRGPLLSPVLTLLKLPTPEDAGGGGHSEKDVVKIRLAAQRAALSAAVEHIAGSAPPILHDGNARLLVEMFDDSLAHSWAPKSMFRRDNTGARLLAPSRNGYVASAQWVQLEKLAKWLRTANSVEARVAISRTKSIRVLTPDDTVSNGIDQCWKVAQEVPGGRAFFLWLMPSLENTERESILSELLRLEENQALLPTAPGIEINSEGTAAVALQGREQRGLAQAMRRYRSDGQARTVAVASTLEKLRQIAASGTVYRIDPVRRIEVTSPGEGPEPAPALPLGIDLPLVAVVDGGLTSRSYRSMEAWRAPPLIADADADHVHGNRIASLIVHAHAWNNRLQLPPLSCRLATVQAVPKASSTAIINPEQLISYLRRIAREVPEAKVWNLSFNQIEPELDPSNVSYLGHEIAQLAREAGILPIISVGNKLRPNCNSIRGPADCEAAITVSGRDFDDRGSVAGACASSVIGPGPDGMLKPDLAWYSQLRMLGGGTHRGSSYATTLVSSLAAHTFANLRSPSPDLVKALLLNTAELHSHSPELGWGTPWTGTVPWECEPGTVTLTWSARLRPGVAYYWQDIPIPPELIRVGKLFGRAKLVAIIKPRLSPLGSSNYFATRVQVALQYQNRQGASMNLLGTMKEDSIPEMDARRELAKWQPVRVHSKEFTSRGGLSFAGRTFKLHARVFARDLFQFDMSHHSELEDQEVNFVLSFSDLSDSPGIYNSTAQMLGNFVESAVLDQHVELTSGT
jgi:hypothetical protein